MTKLKYDCGDCRVEPFCEKVEYSYDIRGDIYKNEICNGFSQTMVSEIKYLREELINAHGQIDRCLDDLTKSELRDVATAWESGGV